ncbi:MAG: octanoyltransferase [Deltaproteobacteria bacterium CG11_big_fil_rev_8_21_14_0_20_47_16]|nr:MAG: octanoyltransferase [Deltaproteobacteria bacterium CG11_big_fil_rev_8_21_14_0_20_47_16]
MRDAALKSSLTIRHLLNKGPLPYQDAYALQESLHAERARSAIPDTLLLLEHAPVFTTGRQDVSHDWLLTQDEIRAHNIDIVNTNRGGRITYHGPGQLVGYFICDLKNQSIGVADFVHWVEEGLIGNLKSYGITATRDAENPGVWVGQQKIAAIGLHVKKGITLHGFALNVTTDLTPYTYCIPCGIQGKGVTSLSTLLPQQKWSVETVAQDLGNYFCSMAANVGSSPSTTSSVNMAHSSA